MAEQLEPVPSVRVHQDGDRESATVLFDLTPERICKQRSCDCELQAKVYYTWTSSCSIANDEAPLRA